MPYTLKTQQIAVKDLDTGTYVGVDILTEQTTEGLLNELIVTGNSKKTEVINEGVAQVANVHNAGTAQVAAVNNAGQELIESLPSDYTELDDTVKRTVKGGFIYDTASGDIAAFDDAADGMLLKSLVTNIELTQDFNGYDRPWAGGAGKNKLVYPYKTDGTTVDGITYTVNSDGSITVSGTYTGSASYVNYSMYSSADGAMPLPNGTYILSASCDTATTAYIRVSPNRGTGASEFQVNSSLTATITNNELYSISLRVPQAELSSPINITVYPMVRLASVSDSTWEPYANICPVTGWTSITGVRTGENLFDRNGVTWKQNYNIDTEGHESYSSSYKYTENYYKIPGGSELTFSYKKGSSSGTNLSVPFYDKNKNFIERLTPIAVTTGTGRLHGTITAPDNACYCRFSTGKSGANTDYQIELGTTDGTYHVYDGESFSTSWSDTAGTIYSCTIDVVSGELNTDTAEIASYNGETIPGVWFSDRDIYSSGTSPTIGAHVVYYLAEPVFHQIDGKKIACLGGTNRIWVNAGDASVIYPVDTKTYIDRKIQEAVAEILGS